MTTSGERAVAEFQRAQKIFADALPLHGNMRDVTALLDQCEREDEATSSPRGGYLYTTEIRRILGTQEQTEEGEQA